MKNLIVLITLLFTQSLFAMKLISHRGVHQTYHRKNLTMTTCTAKRIDNTGHSYLENTLESIETAFNYGAEIVEIDVHPTTEQKGNTEILAVFHDWTLDCRTNATCPGSYRFIANRITSGSGQARGREWGPFH